MYSDLVTATPLTIPTLRTQRLNLAPLSMAHSAGMYATWSNPLVHQFSGPAQDKTGNPIELPARSPDASNRLIEFWLKAAHDGWGFRWAITRQRDRGFVGHIGFNALGDCAEIAYHMNPTYWGRGYMTEVALAAIAWCGDVGTSEVDAYIEPANTRSIALACRLGLVPTGQFVDGAQRYKRSI